MKDKLAGVCVCTGSKLCVFCVQMTIVGLSTVFGILIFLFPRKTIDMQIAVYRSFNWKIEPVSWEKEINNMRLFGVVLFVAGLVAAALVISCAMITRYQ